MTFICSICRNRVDNPYNQFGERCEYRRLDSLERPLSFHVRDVCRDCVETIREQRHNPTGVEQGRLL